MKGLIVRSPWIELILEGKKTWEIRGSNTSIRGKIALIKSGTGKILGCVDIVDSKKISLSDYHNSINYHCVENAKQFSLYYKNTYAWVLNNPMKFDVPITYIHPKGAVIWVNLDNIYFNSVL